jgi:hypothetical protein
MRCSPLLQDLAIEKENVESWSLGKLDLFIFYPASLQGAMTVMWSQKVPSTFLAPCCPEWKCTSRLLKLGFASQHPCIHVHEFYVCSSLLLYGDELDQCLEILG